MSIQVWDLFYNSSSVRDMIKQKIQEESLRTYLFSYSSVYDSLSLDILASMFELDKAVVHSIVSKMIINEELMVSRNFVLTFVTQLQLHIRFDTAVHWMHVVVLHTSQQC